MSAHSSENQAQEQIEPIEMNRVLYDSELQLRASASKWVVRGRLEMKGRANCPGVFRPFACRVKDHDDDDAGNCLSQLLCRHEDKMGH